MEYAEKQTAGLEELKALDAGVNHRHHREWDYKTPFRKEGGFTRYGIIPNAGR